MGSEESVPLGASWSGKYFFKEGRACSIKNKMRKWQRREVRHLAGVEAKRGVKRLDGGAPGVARSQL